MVAPLAPEKVARLRECLTSGMSASAAARVVGCHHSAAEYHFHRFRGVGAGNGAAEMRAINEAIDSCPETAPHKEWFRDAPWKRAGGRG